MEDNMLLELLNASIDETIGECQMVCTDTMNAMTEALEVYELECISNIREMNGMPTLESDFQYPTTVKREDDSKDDNKDNKESSDKQKKSTKKFFQRIADFLKAAIQKIIEVGKKIWGKLQELWKIIKDKINRIKTSKFFGGKPWPNGFDIDFKSGEDSIRELQNACSDVSKEMSDKFTDFGLAVQSGDRKKMVNFANNNTAFVQGFYKHPRELINEGLKGPKIGDSDNAINQWLNEVFKYEPKGQDFRMDVKFQQDMARQVMRTQISIGGTLGIYQELMTSDMKHLRSSADDVEKYAKIAETKTIYPTMGPVLRGFASMMVSTAEFGLVSTSQSCKFLANKYNTVIDHFVKVGILQKAS